MFRRSDARTPRSKVPTSAVVSVTGCVFDTESGSCSNRTVFSPASRIVLVDVTGWLAQPETMDMPTMINSARSGHDGHCVQLFGSSFIVVPPVADRSPPAGLGDRSRGFGR